jgi:hypothetical protein
LATFDFSGTLPQTKALISSAQLRNRYNDLKTHINTNNVSGVVFGTTASAAQYQAFLLDATKLAGTWTHVVRTDAAMEFTGAGSLAHGDILFVNSSGQVTRLAAGTSGRKLQTNGAGADPTWVSVATTNAWSQKTTNFSTTAGGRFKCTSGVTSIALHTPADGEAEFYIKPEIGNDLAANTIALTGAMNVAGAAAANYTLDQNAIYHFTSDGTDYDVSAYQIER